jgi:hypothetical protein
VGIYGRHAASRTLAGKVYLLGFYWPTTLADAESVVQVCKGCQFYT